MSRLGTLVKQLAVATIEMHAQLNPVTHVLVTTAIDLLAGLMLEVQSSQNQTAGTLSRIEEKIDRQRTAHFDTALQLLKDVQAVKNSTRRKNLLSDAIHELTYAATSETGSDSTRGKTEFWIGFCYDLLQEQEAAAQHYTEAMALLLNDFTSKLAVPYYAKYYNEVFLKKFPATKVKTIRQAYKIYRDPHGVLSLIVKSRDVKKVDALCLALEGNIDYINAVYYILKSRNVTITFSPEDTALFEDALLVFTMRLEQLHPERSMLKLHGISGLFFDK